MIKPHAAEAAAIARENYETIRPAAEAVGSFVKEKGLPATMEGLKVSSKIGAAAIAAVGPRAGGAHPGGSHEGPPESATVADLVSGFEDGGQPKR